jgi:hypothetical protein
MRKRIGIAMLGALAIGTIWSFGYDWKIAAILYATAVALIVYLGVALWLIFPDLRTRRQTSTDSGLIELQP